MSLVDLEEALATRFDSPPRVDTVAGLVIDLLGKVPAVGDVVECGGFQFSCRRCRI